MQCLWDVHYSVLCHWGLCALICAVVIGVCTPVWGHVPCLRGLHALLETCAMALGGCALVGTCAVPSGCVCCYRDRCRAVGVCIVLWECVLCHQDVHSAIPTLLWERVPWHWGVCVLLWGHVPCQPVLLAPPGRLSLSSHPACHPSMCPCREGSSLITKSQLLSRGTL